MVYIHVPFCRSFCTYCDFYSEIACRGKDTEIFDGYVAELCGEMDRRREEIEATRALNTLYIGGGTPSVLPPHCLNKIVSGLDCGSFDEFTIEVNPEDIVEKGPDYVAALSDIGANRISMGVQSLDDKTLKWMNRRHSSDGARRAFDILRHSGMDNVSVDIIFGISDSGNSLKGTLDEILEWKPEHVSAYQLSIEEGSTLALMRNRGEYTEASDEKCRLQYDFIRERLASNGYEHYEISNWALPGRRAVHNSAYWHRLPYAGLGPGAHSLKGENIRSWNSKDLSGWTSSEEYLSQEEIREERLMLGLRTLEGVDGKRIPESDWFISDSLITDIVLS